MRANVFAKCKTLADIALVARKLKAEGEDPAEVNKLVAARRAELITDVGDFNKLEMVTIRASSIPSAKTSHIRFNFSGSTDSNVISISQDRVVTF